MDELKQWLEEQVRLIRGADSSWLAGYRAAMQDALAKLAQLERRAKERGKVL